MAHSTVRRVLPLFISALACAALLFGLGAVNFAGVTGSDHAHTLKPPPFLNVAYAQGVAPEAAPASVFDGEAGIAAYFKSPTPISISSVLPIYRTIETQTAVYVIGSVAVPNYPESQDVHLYIHADGWAMAYYLKADPTAKIFDWWRYSGGTVIPTRLENVLGILIAEIGIAQPTISFYHFQYPNATHMLLVADDLNAGAEDSFQINLTSAYGYFERSWGLGTEGGLTYYVDSTKVYETGSSYSWKTAEGTLTPSLLSVDMSHAIRLVPWGCCPDRYAGGLALIYRVP